MNQPQRILAMFTTVSMMACNFITDEELAYRMGGDGSCSTVWYLDADGDGFGGEDSLVACAAPGAEYIQQTGDCNDQDAAISPEAIEDCATEIDEDCDGTRNTGSPDTVDPLSCVDWYADRDADGFGDDFDVRCNCTGGDVYTVRQGGDCEDQIAIVNPEQPEVCGDGWDNNCDGSANGCGYTEAFSLIESQWIVGEADQAYAGSNLAMGPLLKTGAAAALILSTGCANDYGCIDVFDADTINTADDILSTSDALLRITGESDSDFGHQIYPFTNLVDTEDVDLLVSAPNWIDTEGRTVGKVYLFEGPLVDSRPASDAYSAFVGAGEGDQFGSALSHVGNQVWIGAMGSDLGAINGGAVYVYATIGEALVHQMTATEPSMRFGSSLSQPADLNGDGIADIAVGAYGANDSKGAVHVFWNAAGLTALAPSDSDVAWNGSVPNEEAGRRVEVVGDITGDGYTNLLISAPNASRAYIVSANQVSTSLLDEATVTVIGEEGTALGSSIAQVGDFNGDGQSDVVLGGFIGSQIAIAYGPLLGTYTADDLIVMQNRGSDQLGWSLAGGLDLTGDDVNDILVGAKTASEGLNKNGVVFMMTGRGL